MQSSLEGLTMKLLLNVLAYDVYLRICLIHFTQGHLSFGPLVLVRHYDSLYKRLHCDFFYRLSVSLYGDLPMGISLLSSHINDLSIVISQ